MSELIGYAAATLTTVAFVPQVIRVYRTRSVEDISTGMYLAFLVGVTMWVLYGIRIGSLPVVIANAVTFVLASAVLVGKMRYGRREGPAPD